MSKAKVGTGELRPHRKGPTGSTSIGGSTNKEHVREGFYDNVQIGKASKNVTELTPFKMGPPGPGVNSGDTHNPMTPPFHERQSGGILNPNGYRAFKE